MHVAILGTGAVGGYFGALLARSGVQVTFIARGAHLQAIRSSGLRVLGPRGDIVVQTAEAADDPRTLRDADVILFCVKTYDTDAAARAIAPAIGAGTAVITLQNGIDSAERIGHVLPADRIVPGTAYVAGQIEAPGVIRYTSEMSSIVFGPGTARLAATVAAFRDAAIRAGFAATIDPAIDVALWSKFAILAPNASLTSLSRKPASVVFHDPAFLALATDAIREVVAVGRACDVALPDDIVERGLKIVRAFPPDMYASMYHDLARGRPLEVEEVQGALVRLGEKHGVPTPIHRTAYCCLKPYAAGAVTPVTGGRAPAR